MKSLYRKNSIWSFATIAVASAMTLVSCSEDIMDDKNYDYDHPTDSPAKFVFADVCTSTAFYNVGGDVNTYSSIYMEHLSGVDNQLYNAEIRVSEPTASSTMNNSYQNLYTTMRDAKIVVEKNEDDLSVACGKVMLAYNLALTTDIFGDVPFSEALNKDNKQPALDKQEDIYKNVMQMLDEAIELLETSPSNTLQAYDFIYKGDAESWKKFAYGLKARYTMRLLLRSADKDADLQKVIEYADNSFGAKDEEAAFNVYDASNLNPSFDFQWSRDGVGASKSVHDKMLERNDPRLNGLYFDPYYWNHIPYDSEDLSLFENGVSPLGVYAYSYPAYTYAQTASTLLLSYHEVQFLKAEAYARLGDNDKAAEALLEALKGAFVTSQQAFDAAMVAPSLLEYGGLYYDDGDVEPDPLDDAAAEAYFNNSVKPLFDADPLKEIMIQKYIAFFGASGESTETYNDYRRMLALGEDYIVLANPKNAEGKFPLRMPYGADAVLANPKISAAYGTGQYVYKENVWWAGGSR